MLFSKDVTFCLPFKKTLEIFLYPEYIETVKMLSMKYVFNGTFDHTCQKNSVPESFQALIRIILNGPRIENSEG